MHITAQNLVDWSSEIESRSLLPVLIRRLIHSTAVSDGIQEIDFPSDESTNSSGYDGTLNYQGTSNTWIPQGQSVWELSTAEDVQKKANADFDKRNSDPLGKDISDTVYVGVSSRRFSGKNEWKDDKRQNSWKEVRFYDADDLSQWLEISPAASFWFAEQTKHQIAWDGMFLLENYWTNLKSSTSDNIRISPEVFINSRLEQVKTLTDFLKGRPQKPLSIKSDDDETVLDFIAAVVAAMEDKEKDTILSRSFILDDEVNWNQITAALQPLILISKSPLTANLAPVQHIGNIRNKHHLIRIAPNFRQDNSVMQLARFNKFELQQAFTQTGCSYIEASQLAEKVGGSGTNLRNLISDIPPVISDERSKPLFPFVLLGGWQRTNQGDRDIICKFCNIDDYGKVEAAVMSECQHTDPLFYIDTDAVCLYSKHQAWHLFAAKVSKKDLEDLLAIAEEILGEKNPCAVVQKFYFSYERELLNFSSVLKECVADMLACLASLYDTDAISFSDPALDKNTVQHLLDNTIAAILHENLTMEEWAAKDLPILAEISPKSVIGAIRHELQKGEDSIFTLLMQDSGNVLTSPCNHGNLLSALEVLSLSEDYHKDAAEALFSLMKIDKGGHCGNRPHNSLKEHIYCYWHLCSDISLEERLLILDNLLKKKEDVVWQVLFETAFEPPYSVALTSFPKYRNWGLSVDAAQTSADGYKFRYGCAERVLSNLGTHFSRWNSIFRHIRLIAESEPFRDNFMDIVDNLQRNIPADWSDEQKETLIKIIREKTDNAGWQDDVNSELSDKVINKLKDFIEHIESPDIAVRNAWMFDENAKWKSGQFRDNEKLWKTKREEIVLQIVEKDGLDGLNKLIESVLEPALVADTFISMYADKYFEQIIPSFFTESDKKKTFASAFLYRLCNGEFKQWEQCYKSRCHETAAWNVQAVLPFLFSFRCGMEQWNLAESFDKSVQNEFWSRQNGYYYGIDLNKDTVKYVFERLIRFKNYNAALNFAANEEHGKYKVAITDKLSILHTAVEHNALDNQHAVIDIIVSLQKQFLTGELQNDEEQQLARIELLFIHWLNNSAAYRNDSFPKVLTDTVIKSPDFFVELLRYAYRPSKDEIENYTEDELPNKEQMARNVYELLHNMRQLPENICEWVKGIRKLAKQYARLAVGDMLIGKLFGRCSSQVFKGELPASSIMQVLELTNSNNMFNGFHAGIYNSRGITMRSAFDGGKQERELADNFMNLFKLSKNEYPRTAKVFECLAENYFDSAKKEDESVQRRNVI